MLEVHLRKHPGVELKRVVRSKLLTPRISLYFRTASGSGDVARWAEPEGG